MNSQEILNRIKEIQKEISNLPYISIYDEDGEPNEEAYQEKLEQGYYIRELRDEMKELLQDLENECALNSLENQTPEC